MEDASATALYAIQNAGYVHLDSAMFYQNEADIGKAVRESGLPREDIFVTTKMTPDQGGKKSAAEFIDASLKLMDIGYIDQYLLHAPMG